MSRITDADGRGERFSLDQVIDKEAEYLRGRRALADRETPADQREGLGGRIAAERRPIGLAFSGGGIRSATFNLGVLQALSSQQILPHVDYLRTLSGGR